jgi:hypothetical protein
MTSACLLKHCDPYDPLRSTPIEQRTNPLIDRLFKCTKVKPTETLVKFIKLIDLRL